MSKRYERWRQRLATIASAGLRRTLVEVRSTGATTATVAGQPVVVACSNDYLGLASHPALQAGGGGAGASRLIGGSRPIHHRLEEAIEAWFGRPALLFSSGYHANLAVFSTVCERGDIVASDALNHASIIDGLRLSRAQRLIVPHATPHAIPERVRLIAVEGLFSMDGDVPPLRSYPRGPWLAVDEAHALGCLGPDGRGAAASLGVIPDIVIGTFGKAFGSAGAFVVGPPELKALLVNAGRTFIFTTAVPESVAAAALAAIRVTEDGFLRELLADRVRRFRSGLRDLGWRPMGDAHIVPIVVGPSAMRLSEKLMTHGILAPGIRAPTVPAGSERIRFTVSARHTDEQQDRILEALGPRDSFTE